MAVLCVFLAIACGYDYRYRRIPNWLVVVMAGLGMGRQLWSSGAGGIFSYLIGAAMVIVLMYPFFKIGGLGAGDVKLLGVTAGYLPFGKTLVFLFLSLLITAMISLRKIWKKNDFRECIQRLSGYLGDIVGGDHWRLYLEKEADRKAAGVCLSGPILVSVLLYWGGVY